MGLADREARYDPTSEGRRVPDHRHYEYHVPYRSRRFHRDWTAVKQVLAAEANADARITATVCAVHFEQGERTPLDREAGLGAFEVSLVLPALVLVRPVTSRRSFARWRGCACGQCRCGCP
jgi:hypothetical protein